MEGTWGSTTYVPRFTLIRRRVWDQSCPPGYTSIVLQVPRTYYFPWQSQPTCINDTVWSLTPKNWNRDNWQTGLLRGNNHQQDTIILQIVVGIGDGDLWLVCWGGGLYYFLQRFVMVYRTSVPSPVFRGSTLGDQILFPVYYVVRLHT